MTQAQPTRPLPSVAEFTGLSDTVQREVYMRACKAQCEGRVRDQKKRDRLLVAYARAAGWDQESVRTMRAAVQTLTHST